MDEREVLAKQLHQIYSDEVWRQHQGDPSREVRWQQSYKDLPEEIKQLDRVLADFILAREAKLKEEMVPKWILRDSMIERDDVIKGLYGKIERALKSLSEPGYALIVIANAKQILSE